MIKAIIFDFGNVICTFDNNVFLEKITRYTGKPLEELDRLIYRESGLPKLYETGLVSSDEFFEKITALCGLDISKEKFIEAYTNIFFPIRSTFDLIKRLKKRYKLALLTNTSEWDFKFGMKPLEIFDLFDAVSLSFEIKAMKPDPKIYRNCLMKLALAPTECVYIDDIKEYCEAAEKIGISGINYVSRDALVNSLKSLGVRI